MFEIVDEKRDGAVIKVIGVGGCGGNAVDQHMIGKAWPASSSLPPTPMPRRWTAMGAEARIALGAN